MDRGVQEAERQDRVIIHTHACTYVTKKNPTRRDTQEWIEHPTCDGPFLVLISEQPEAAPDPPGHETCATRATLM